MVKDNKFVESVQVVHAQNIDRNPGTGDTLGEEQDTNKHKENSWNAFFQKSSYTPWKHDKVRTTPFEDVSPIKH